MLDTLKFWGRSWITQFRCVNLNIWNKYLIVENLYIYIIIEGILNFKIENSFLKGFYFDFQKM